MYPIVTVSIQDTCVPYVDSINLEILCWQHRIVHYDNLRDTVTYGYHKTILRPYCQHGYTMLTIQRYLCTLWVQYLRILSCVHKLAIQRYCTNIGYTSNLRDTVNIGYPMLTVSLRYCQHGYTSWQSRDTCQHRLTVSQRYCNLGYTRQYPGYCQHRVQMLAIQRLSANMLGTQDNLEILTTYWYTMLTVSREHSGTEDNPEQYLCIVLGTLC